MVGTPGVHVMSITPFDRTGGIDESLMRAHLRFVAAAGVGVYVASQGSGEGDLLSFDEKVALYRIAVDELGGRVPVVAAGIGLAASTGATRDLAVAAARAAVDAVQLVAPRPGPVRLRDDELEAYFRSVVEAVECEVHISNNVALAGYELPMGIVRRLIADYAHVRAVNVSDPRPAPLRAYVSELVERCGATIDVRVGMVRDIVEMHALGARGVLCFEPNVAPNLVSVVWQELQAGAAPDVDGLLRLNAALAKGGNPRSLKAALAIIGRDGGDLRAPYLPLTDADYEELASELRRLELA
ncbi:MAG TPA: dihydrodipicolinate synthase family protein [Acidimicrobiia bacterium]|nr:dihydrodipicolinate synthase family protein [Acidimicrobiia bacterium]